ncbi:sulfate permease, SulP family [Cyclonatronum proteinivorum]|uniref:Sulfate permease, SulP family n=1 Tax=Cyclonatronum proteinivorum TaxID=1457365 RepID=A0A345UL19_9BACT|nr:sulfate permease [Cyclonatronum proteinivorum]AXJ01171.1 sulfate permease, SulP family [Cyclonatronum proteinivorum]
MIPAQSILQRFLPVTDWLPKYDRSQLKGDLSAGLTVGVMLIPQGMAYALIAGLPPQYGLYASVVPLLIYAMLGSSRHLGVGPVALVALLVAAAVSPVAQSPEEFLALSIILALMVGLLQLVFGLLRLGFVVNLLSHPVLSGFISAAAIIIGLSQVHHLLGISSVSGSLHDILWGLGTQLGGIKPITLAVGIAGIALMILGKKYVKALPAPVMVLLAGIFVVWITGLHQTGLSVVGTIPAGLPPFAVPALSAEAVSTLFPMALAIALVAYMEAIAVAKAIQQRDKSYKINPDQELIALGASNVAGSFFLSFPVTGSFSRTAVNFDTGGKTPLASVISALVVLVTLLFLTPVFFYLPHAVLAAVIIVSVYGLIEFGQFRTLWKLGHYDRYLFLAAFLGTLFIGIKEGILLGVMLSVAMLLYRSARPNHVVLGRLPGTQIYRDIRNYETEQNPTALIFRFDAPLHFANAEFYSDKVSELIQHKPETRFIILDFNGINDIDSTGLEALHDLLKDIRRDNRVPMITEAKFAVRSMIKKAWPEADVPQFFMRIEDAVEAAGCIDEPEADFEKRGIYTDLRF